MLMFVVVTGLHFSTLY